MLIWPLLIPVITCLVLWKWFYKETVWWEYLVVVLPSVLVTIIGFFIFREIRVSDIHYKSEVVTRVRHYDKWNEYIRKTCTSTHRVGKTTVTRRYDCSYVKTHPEEWEMITTSGKKIPIEKSVYDYYRKLWGTHQKFIDMHRRYHTIDGDAQEYKWDGNKEHALTHATHSTYRNFFRLPGTLYSLEDMSDEEADSLGLPEYPSCGYVWREGWVYDQNPIIGIKPSPGTRRYAQWVNTRYKDLRIIIVYFKGTDYFRKARELERYWKRGKDNEVVFVIGLDSLNRKIGIYSFSWSPEPLLEGYVKMECKRGDPREILELSQKAYSKGYWKPRVFSDYSYLTIELKGSDYSWLFWITLLVNIFISYWVITNDEKREGS